MKRSTSWTAVLPSLVIPACIGLMMYLGMLTLIQHEFISNETVLRYLTGHPVSKITLAMFFIGLASLGMIGVNVFEQFGAEKKIRLSDSASFDGESAEHVVERSTPGLEDSDDDSKSVENLAAEQNHASSKNNRAVELAVSHANQLLAMPKWLQDHYLWQRIVNAFHFVYRTGGVQGVEDELKYLAEIDLDRQNQRYSLVRILIWATPMLGFLGTVLGISQALGGISVGPENDFQQMMNGLRGSLYVAFDTTALALTLSMILMFGQFLVDRFESQLLQLVDQRARAEVSGAVTGLAEQGDATQPALSTPDPELNQSLLDVMNSAVNSQTEIWRKTISAAEKAWTASLSEVSGQVQESLSAALDASVYDLAHYLGQSIEKADLSMAHRWEQWQVLLSDNARQLEQHQCRLAEQTTLIQSLLEKSDEISSLQPAIDKNLHAIEETSRLRESLDELSKVVGELANEEASADEHRETAIESETVKSAAEVILPFPVKNNPTEEQSAGNSNDYLPEVIIPFPKKAA